MQVEFYEYVYTFRIRGIPKSSTVSILRAGNRKSNQSSHSFKSKAIERFYGRPNRKPWQLIKLEDKADIDFLDCAFGIPSNRWKVWQEASRIEKKEEIVEFLIPYLLQEAMK